MPADHLLHVQAPKFLLDAQELLVYCRFWLAMNS